MLEVQQGDGNAFAVLFDRYNRLVLTVALRIVHDAAEAQEVTQDVFFEFYRCARRFDAARGTLKVWLLQFAYHRSINRRNYLLLRQFYNRPDLEEAIVWEASAKRSPLIPAQELKQVVEEALTQTEENIVPSHMRPTQSGKRMSQGLHGVRPAARFAAIHPR
jgi:RNA polymerase sigma-70 factor (ECF subfamily)